LSVLIETTKEKNSRGEYIQHLLIDDKIWMSNDDIEYEDIERSLQHARGDCFIGGLGLGVIAQECSKKDDVRSILVVEKNEEVAKLVAESALKLKKFHKDDDYWCSEKSKIVVMLGDARCDFDDLDLINPIYDWMYLDTYDEPTEVAYYEHVVPFVKNAKNVLKKDGVVDYWCKPKFDKKDFIK